MKLLLVTATLMLASASYALAGDGLVSRQSKLVWEDENGTVWITYNTGEYVVGRHGAKNADEAARRLTFGSERFAKTAAE
jgi:hypothetical protein